MGPTAGKAETANNDAVVDVQLTGSHQACLAMLEALHAHGFPVENASAPYPIGSAALVRMSADVLTRAGEAADAEQ